MSLEGLTSYEYLAQHCKIRRHRFGHLVDYRSNWRNHTYYLLLVPGFSSKAVGESKTYEIKNEISILDIDIRAINLEVRTSTDSSIRVESNYKYLTVTEKDNRLIIKDKKVPFYNYQGMAITRLYIPNEKIFDRVDFNSGAGRADLENLQAKSIYMKFGAGQTSMKDIFASENAFIEAGADN